jgi:hypothetical protein
MLIFSKQGIVLVFIKWGVMPVISKLGIMLVISMEGVILLITMEGVMVVLRFGKHPWASISYQLQSQQLLAICAWSTSSMG